MLYKLRETKANLLKMTDNQLDTTTKRTIAENDQLSSELAWQSKETEKLIRRNDALLKENKGLQRELSLQKETQHEFAKKVRAGGGTRRHWMVVARRPRAHRLRGRPTGVSSSRRLSESHGLKSLPP